ncbi:hypothetical protein TrST_g10906 [Triparma strigata]|uniref:Heme oxygenase n=1 Tax=Triparma strigata TaxID=1606541 RepID=A0A9W7AT58_9STRA|nr:hypothetical protein TrST_g10906 [Triparma strigata]
MKKGLSQSLNLASARLSSPLSSPTSSRGILQTSSANKTGLSLRLDSTLKDGHDMKTFGLGTAATLSSRHRYAKFTSSMLHAYEALENSLDECASEPVSHVWKEFKDDLRRSEKLKEDFYDVKDALDCFEPSVATKGYVNSMVLAGKRDDKDGGGRLIGHLYCRYFADLMGGQVLAYPTRLALGLKGGTPRHYDFGKFGEERKVNVERLYRAFNEAGEMMGPEKIEDVVEETYLAFEENVKVYKEDGRLWQDSAIGGFNVVKGLLHAQTK